MVIVEGYIVVDIIFEWAADCEAPSLIIRCMFSI